MLVPPAPAVTNVNVVAGPPRLTSNVEPARVSPEGRFNDGPISNSKVTPSIWNVSPDEADAFCDCTATKVVSNFSEDGLQKVLSDVKRARGIPMLPMAVFARFGDDAKATVQACK